MSEKQIQRAREFIQKKRYDRARAILQPLALEDETAYELLQDLNMMAPPSQKRSGVQSGALVAVLVGIGVCLLLIVPSVLTDDADQPEIQEVERTVGTKGNPVPVGLPLQFEDFDVLPGEFIFPASSRIGLMNPVNETPADGMEYALLNITLICQREEGDPCYGFELNVQLVDNEGMEWGAPEFLVLEPDLASQEAVDGRAMTGWVGFEFPAAGKTVEMVKMWVTEGDTLYADMVMNEQ